MTLDNTNGHELVRLSLLAMLRTNVPLRLATIRTALGTPPDELPDPVFYGLDERWPSLAQWPALVIPSTELTDFVQQQGDDSIDYVGTYSVQVAVGCRVDEHKASDRAAIQRDRLLLAVREALMWNRAPHPRVQVQLTELREEAGTPSPEIADRPHAMGVIAFTVRATERSVVSPTEPTALTADVTVSPVVTSIESLEA